MIDITLTILALIGAGFSLELFTAGDELAGDSEEHNFRLAVAGQAAIGEFQCGNPS
jgi:hypothetical protein